MGQQTSAEERDALNTYAKNTKGPLYYIIQYLISATTTPDQFGPHLDQKLGEYIQYLLYNEPYTSPFPPPLMGDELSQYCIDFYSTTTTAPTFSPMPPTIPSTLFNADNLNTTKPIVSLLKQFATIYQPQPLLSLIAFCTDPNPIQSPPQTWQQRLDAAQTYVDETNISDEDLSTF